jgi:spore coat protein U-like protein
VSARTKLSLALGLTLLGVLAGSPAARAACSVSTTSLGFGTYDVFATAPLDSTGNVVFRCGQTDKNISISLDTGGAPSFVSRRLTSGSDALLYNLYLDAARTSIWGDGTGGTQVYFNRNPQSNNLDIYIPIYGRIPAGQDVSAGIYTNTITVIIAY